MFPWWYSRFEAFKSCGDRHGDTALSLQGAGAEDGVLWQAGAVYGEAQNWARYLSDMPANKMTPVDFAQVREFYCFLGTTFAKVTYGISWVEIVKQYYMSFTSWYLCLLLLNRHMSLYDQ